MGFDHAYGWLRDQLDTLDEYDRKLGVALTVQFAITAALLTIDTALVRREALRVAVLGLLALAQVSSAAALLVRPNRKAPEPAQFVTYAGLPVAEMKWRAVPALLEAIRINTLAITWKRRLFAFDVVALALIGAGVLLGRVFNLT